MQRQSIKRQAFMAGALKLEDLSYSDVLPVLLETRAMYRPQSFRNRDSVSVKVGRYWGFFTRSHVGGGMLVY